MAAGDLPEASYAAVWSCIVSHVFDRLVEGFSRIRRCSNEGRGLMLLDSNIVFNAAKAAGPVRYVNAATSSEQRNLTRFRHAEIEQCNPCFIMRSVSDSCLCRFVCWVVTPALTYCHARTPSWTATCKHFTCARKETSWGGLFKIR